jgi:hypothetical protein
MIGPHRRRRHDERHEQRQAITGAAARNAKWIDGAGCAGE